MKRFILLTALLFSFSSAHADGFELEFGYAFVMGEGDGVDVDLGALYGIGGYRWEHQNNYSSSAELLIAFGIQDDNVGPVNVDLEPSYSLGYRGTWQTSNPDVDLFWRASFARLEAKVDALGVFSASESETGFGLGVGGTFKGLTLGYTVYLGDLDDFSAVNIGYRFGLNP